jgi:IS30 family transposase
MSGRSPASHFAWKPQSCATATDYLEAVAHALNTRPRKMLGWKTPAEAFNEQLMLIQQAGVASTG